MQSSRCRCLVRSLCIYRHMMSTTNMNINLSTQVTQLSDVIILMSYFKAARAFLQIISSIEIVTNFLLATLVIGSFTSIFISFTVFVMLQDASASHLISIQSTHTFFLIFFCCSTGRKSHREESVHRVVISNSSTFITLPFAQTCRC